MNKIVIENEKGWNGAIIDRNCDFEKFYYVADLMQREFDIKFSDKLNDFDTLYWDFSYKENLLTLHYNIYLGVSIHPKNLKHATASENDMVIELGQRIANRTKD